MNTKIKSIWAAGLLLALTAAGSAVARPIAVDDGQWQNFNGDSYSFNGLSVCLGADTKVWIASDCSAVADGTTSFIQALSGPVNTPGQIRVPGQAGLNDDFRVRWIGYNSGTDGTPLDATVKFSLPRWGRLQLFALVWLRSFAICAMPERS